MNDIDEQYRRASAQDPSQPSESTRRNILAHAAKLAAQRTANNDPVRADFRRDLSFCQEQFRTISGLPRRCARP